MDRIEKEFLKYKLLYMYNVIVKKATQYYKDIEDGKLRLPDFMRDDAPETRAKEETKEILKTDIERFYRLYDEAIA